MGLVPQPPSCSVAYSEPQRKLVQTPTHIKLFHLHLQTSVPGLCCPPCQYILLGFFVSGSAQMSTAFSSLSSFFSLSSPLLFFLFLLTFSFLHVFFVCGVLPQECLCIPVYSCLQKPKEGAGSPGPGVRMVVAVMGALGMKHCSSGRAALVLPHRACSPATAVSFRRKRFYSC